MPNEHLAARLGAVLSILRDAYTGGSRLEAPSKGSEREAFINLVLSNVIAPPFRVGTGEITDARGNCSGQVDIVVEYAASMSFPLLRGDSSRLYLAEGVCAVIEVKSNLADQWKEVVPKAERVAALRRQYGTVHAMGDIPQQIPYFVVAYRGWKSPPTLQEHMREKPACDCIDGVLDIDAGMYVGARRGDLDGRPCYGDHNLDGVCALYGLLLSLEQLTSSMIGAKPSYLRYVK
jgi:hypothetical protein